MKLVLKICMTALLISFLCVLFAGCNVKTDIGSTKSSEYTWEEFEALTPEQQMEFQNSFDSIEEFDAWLQKAQSENTEKKLPWNNGGKQPSEYTWDEFEALNAEQQMAFQNSFGSIEAFDVWLQSVQTANINRNLPWNNGGKQPSEYTWDEFEALNAGQQMEFQKSFGSTDEFNEWMQNAQTVKTDNTLPWEEGGKQPSEYTWEEFEALNAEQQMAFQKSLGSVDSFDAWLQKAQSKNTENNLPWEKGGKQPSEYTWEEFEALNGEQQMMFQNSFESTDKFDAWLQDAQATETIYPWDKDGAKQPPEYSWNEFNALSGEEQMVFQNSFGNIEEFDKWLTANQPR